MPIVVPVVLPILAAAVCYGAFRTRHPAWGVALGAALGYAAGQWALLGWPDFPPIDVSHGIFYFVLAAGLGRLLYSLLPSAGRTVLPALIMAGLVYFISRPLLQHRWTGWGGLGRVFLLILAAWFVAWALQRWARRHQGFEAPLVLTLLLTAIAVVLVVSRSASLGQIAGSLAAVAGVWTVLSFFVKDFTLAGGTAPMSVGLAGLLLVGHFYAQMPATTAVLLGLAPVSGAVADAFPGLSASTRKTLRIALAVILASAAFMVAYWTLETGDDLYDF